MAYGRQRLQQLAPDIELRPTTMKGTRPTVTLVYSPTRNRQLESQYFANLGVWHRLPYKMMMRIGRL